MLTKENLVEQILSINADFRFNFSNDPNYMTNLLKQIENYIDKTIFDEAIAELTRGNPNSRNSEYSQLIQTYIKNNQSR